MLCDVIRVVITVLGVRTTRDLRLLDSLDIKRSHGRPLLRALAAKVTEPTAGSGSGALSWEELGVTEPWLR